MYKAIPVCVFIVLALPSSAFSQTYTEDFESSQLGDTVGSTGIFGDFADEIVEPNGTNGSNGFRATGSIFGLNGFGSLPVSFGIEEIGDHLTFSVDTRVSISQDTLTVNPSAPELIFNLNIFSNMSDGNFGQIFSQLRFDSVSETYFVSQGFSAQGTEFDFGAPESITDLGFDGGFQGASDYFQFQLDIVKNGIADYDYKTSIFDQSGNLLNDNQFLGINLDPIFNFGQLEPSLGNFSGALDVQDSIEFDNIRYQVTSVPEPNSLALLAFFLCHTCLKRKHYTEEKPRA